MKLYRKKRREGEFLINCLATPQGHYPFGRKKMATSYDGIFGLMGLTLHMPVDHGNPDVIKEACLLGIWGEEEIRLSSLWFPFE